MRKYKITMDGELKRFDIVSHTNLMIRYKDEKSFATKVEAIISKKYYWADTKEQCKDYVINHWFKKLNQLHLKKVEILIKIDKIKNL